MSLTGKVAYVAGGTGTVGGGIAIALLQAGAKVWISSRDENKIEEFKKTIPENLRSKLVGAKGEVTVENEVIQIRDTILQKDKRIDHVISSLGGWWQKGKLSDQSLEEFISKGNDYLTSHFLVYKTFAKVLAQQPGSTYTFITGGLGKLGENDNDPVLPDNSLISVYSPSVYGLYNAARAEFYQHPNLKISQLRINMGVTSVNDNDSPKDERNCGTDFTGRFVVRVAEKHRGGLILVKNRTEAEEVYKNL